MGFDPRIASAFTALGYEIFPFEAYDASGRLVLPQAISVPEQWRKAVGRVQAQPFWEGIYRALSVLDDVNPNWRTFMVGVGFVPGDVRLLLFKSLGSVSGPEAAQGWSKSFNTVVARSVEENAGQTFTIDPNDRETLAQLFGFLKEQVEAAKPQGGDPTSLVPGPHHSHAPATSLDEPSLGAHAIGIWSLPLFSVKLFLALIEAAKTRTKTTNVRATVIWYPTGTMGPIQRPFAERWVPLHRRMVEGRRRTVHGIWNPNALHHRVPAIWTGSDVWRGPSVPDMPHTAEQIARAFFPTLPTDDEQALTLSDSAQEKDSPEGQQELEMRGLASDAPFPTAGPVGAVITALGWVARRIVRDIVMLLVYESGRWVLKKILRGPSKPPDIVYVPEYKRLFYRQRDGSFKPGNVILD